MSDDHDVSDLARDMGSAIGGSAVIIAISEDSTTIAVAVQLRDLPALIAALHDLRERAELMLASGSN